MIAWFCMPFIAISLAFAIFIFVPVDSSRSTVYTQSPSTIVAFFVTVSNPNTFTVISEYLKPSLEKVGSEDKHLGVIVIGTVAGDIHDIGKSIVTSMLFAAGFEILDLGVDVSAEKFIETVKKGNVDVVAMSALLSTTLPMQRETIKALKENSQ